MMPLLCSGFPATMKRRMVLAKARHAFNRFLSLDRQKRF
jgi:hypothetical protein